MSTNSTWNRQFYFGKPKNGISENIRKYFCFGFSDIMYIYTKSEKKVHNWWSNIVNIFLSEGSANLFDVLLNVIFFIFRDYVLKNFFLAPFIIHKALSCNLFIKLLGYLEQNIQTKGH